MARRFRLFMPKRCPRCCPLSHPTNLGWRECCLKLTPMTRTALVPAIFYSIVFSNALLTSQAMNQTSPKTPTCDASGDPTQSLAAALEECGITLSEKDYAEFQRLGEANKALNRELDRLTTELDRSLATLVLNKHFREIEWPIPRPKKRAKARR
jgi:hypothetical protein